MSTGTISLIATVLNEAGSIDRLLESIAQQTRRPDEVVLVDGGSTDGTWERINAWSTRLPLRAVQAAGANISEGRNRAIQLAHGDLIAATDAGVYLDPRWLEYLAAGAETAADVISGFFLPEAENAFEVAMGATVLPRLRDVRPDTFLPSSRSVLFRRAAWERVGGYPTWLDYCEDLVFDIALKRAGCRFTFAPEAIAWFRPRRSLGAFARQYYLYARGDGKAGLWLRRHVVRYAIYALAGLLVARWPRSWWSRGLLLVGAALYTRRPYKRVLPELKALSFTERAQAMALVPVIRIVGDLAKMAGYPVGVLWRLRRRTQPWKAVACA